MDQSEPTLAPQWLKASWSSSISDEHNSGASRNRLPLSVCDRDALRASSSSLFSNSTTGQDNKNHSNSQVYSNFGRRRERYRDRDKAKDRNKTRWEKDSLLENGYTDRQSSLMCSSRWAESLPKRLGIDSNNTHLSTHNSGSCSSVMFEEEFPTLGIKEKQRGPEITRASYPGTRESLSSLHLSRSSLIGDDGWTSALVEVPAVCVGNDTSLSPTQQMVINMSSTCSNVSTGLSMAETLAQAPLKARSASPSSGDHERHKELTLKEQYTKLIPIVNSSDKSKLKASKNGDVISPKVSTPQSLSHQVNQPIKSSLIKPDVLKTSLSGKFHVLNRESSFSNNTKNVPVLNSTTSRVIVSSDDPHPVNGNGIHVEKNKNPPSQSQDRKKFFSLLRDQAKMKNGVSNSEVKTNKQNIQKKTVLAASNSDMKYCTVPVNGNIDLCNGEPEIEALVAPDEEEKAFLESLGWNPNTGEDALTAEEIQSFINKHKEKLKPDFEYRAGLPTLSEECFEKN